VDAAVNADYRTAIAPRPRDPLAIDLDGDGIETTPVVNNGVPTLFDHDADGIRTGTGWLRPDDAWLVLDRNGNGTIDSGRELFGVDTLITVNTYSHTGAPITVTRNAANGFEALRSLDSGNGTAGSAGHGDRVFNASDAQFANVRVWRDLNGDGVSQAAELQSLAAAGIASISLNPTTVNTDLGNGNTITGTAVVTRTNGSTTHVDGVNLSAGNLDLGSNPFYREFPDVIPHTTAASQSPEMGGSGWLRDLREAMSLGTAQAGSLQAQVSQLAAAPNRDAQRALLDGLLQTWARTDAKTTDWVVPYASRYLPIEVRTSLVTEDTTTRTFRYQGIGVKPSGGQGSYIDVELPASYREAYTQHDGRPAERLNAAGHELLRRLGVLQAFNGSYLIDIVLIGPIGGGGSGTDGGGGGGGVVAPNWTRMGTVSLTEDQATLFNASYEALSTSVYRALALQTRLRPYLDAIELVIDAGGVRFDNAAMGQLLATNYSNNAKTGLEDLIELVQFAGPTLQAVDFDGLARLRSVLEALPAGSPLIAVAAGMGASLVASHGGSAADELVMGDAGANSLQGLAGNDTLDGGAGDDQLAGGADDDWLLGRAGNDQLNGDAGNDTLDGGAGNDALIGGVGNNTYLFGRGDGQDYLQGYDRYTGDTNTTRVNTLQFKTGVLPTDLVLRQVNDGWFGNHSGLEVSIAGTTDKVTISGFFVNSNAASEYNPVQQFRFADGTTWTSSTILARLFAGTTGADSFQGTVGNDTISGAAGNDAIAGGAGNDTLLGGADHDTLNGQAGNDTLDGGTGNDALIGGVGNNTYLFGRGDGQDYLQGYDRYTGDTNTTRVNTLQFKTGVLPTDLVLRQVNDGWFGNHSGLEVSIAGTTDKVTISGFFVNSNAASEYNPVQQFRFADGTTWNLATILA
jgi:Ca2+-binding RTX toxin-like protein